MLEPYTEDDLANSLVKRALYVKRLKYFVHLHRRPRNGHEYIHQQRLRDALDTMAREEKWEKMPPIQEKVSPEAQNLIALQTAKSDHFRQITKALVSNKEVLKAKFANRILPVVHDEISCCTFCLGSELCDVIFKLETHNNSPREANLPYLNIVLYLGQHSVVVLLGYMYKWYKVIGMNPTLCEWIYALLACLQKPISDEAEDILSQYYEDFSAKLRRSSGSERDNIVLFTAILGYYFSAPAYKVGPTLERFWELKQQMHGMEV